jgi:hypothetical protein
VKNVAANNHRKKMQMAAYAQKLANAGKADAEEMANATKSVNEVTVIEAPALASDRAERCVIPWLSSCDRGNFRSWLNAFTMTNASSTPAYVWAFSTS